MSTIESVDGPPSFSQSTAFMGVEIHNSGKKIAFHTVDTWFGSDESFHRKDPAIIENRLYEVFLENIEPVSHIVNPIRMTSLAASDEFMDHSLDFVFLDASHEYKDVKDEARNPKSNRVCGAADHTCANRSLHNLT